MSWFLLLDPYPDIIGTPTPIECGPYPTRWGARLARWLWHRNSDRRIVQRP